MTEAAMLTILTLWICWVQGCPVVTVAVAA